MRAARRSFATLALVLAVSLVGTAQAASVDPPAARAADATGRHLVLFRSPDSVPGDLSQRVSALGGSVEAAYPGTGIAAVISLTASQVADRGDHQPGGDLRPSQGRYCDRLGRE